jgi:hypothetical protein
MRTRLHLTPKKSRQLGKGLRLAIPLSLFLWLMIILLIF